MPQAACDKSSRPFWPWQSQDKHYHNQSRTDWHSFCRTQCTEGKAHSPSHGQCLFSTSYTEQLFFPELHRMHTHVKVLEQIVSMINESDTPIH